MVEMSHKKHFWVGLFSYLIAALFLLYEMGVQVSPSVMVHPMMRDLGIDAAIVGMLSSTYFYSYTLMQIPAGLLFDRVPAKYILLCAISSCALGIFMFSVVQSVLLLAVARFLTGLGSSCAFVGVLVVAARWFPRRYFAFLVGVAQFLAAVGALGGELPLSVLVNDVGWRQAAVYLSVLGVALFLLVWLVMRRHDSEKVSESFAWDRLFTSVKRVVRNQRLWWIALYAFCSWTAMAVFASLWGVPYLMQRFAVGSTSASYIAGVIWIALAIVSPCLGWAVQRVCIHRLLRWTAAIGCVSMTAMLYWPNLSYAGAVVAAVGVGAAAGGQILTFDLLREVQGQDDLGIAVGFNNMALVASGALLQPISGWVLRWQASGAMQHGIPVYSTANYQMALLLVPLTFLVAWLVSLFKLKSPSV